MVRGAADLLERVEPRRAGCADQRVPRVGSEPDHTGQISLDVAKSDRADKCTKICAEAPYDRLALGIRLHRDDQENRIVRERRNDGLRAWARHTERIWDAHQGLLRDVPASCTKLGLLKRTVAPVPGSGRHPSWVRRARRESRPPTCRRTRSWVVKPARTNVGHRVPGESW